MRALWAIRVPARTLLAIDALGAAVTSLLTAFVLAPARLATGLPPQPLYLLALLAAAFCLLGTIAFATRSNPMRTLRVLAAANLAYCLATAALCLTHRTTLTRWGSIYFAVEIPIVLALAAVEVSAAKAHPPAATTPLIRKQTGLETGTSGSTTTSG